MTKMKVLGWDKRPRTMLRHIKPGDLFAFSLGDGKFGLGRIVSKISVGHIAEVFDVVANSPDVHDFDVNTACRAMPPVILDSYSLFDKKSEGDWRIIAHDEGFVPSNMENVFFTYGAAAGSCRKVDYLDRETAISKAESDKLPDYSPEGELRIKRELLKNRPRLP